MERGEFSGKYRTTKLVRCEVADSIEVARDPEPQIKSWHPSKKAWRIERENPYWEDISWKVG
jgi:predicted GIY-YIG superfamily endonuclease